MALLHPLRREAVTDLASYTNRPDCPKCGGVVFKVNWWPNTSSQPQTVMAWQNGDAPLTPREHLRHTCDRCGWTFAMQPKDATNA